MINWSDIVGSQTAGGFRTIDGQVYGFRNDIQVNEARGVNIVGNPTHFFSNNAFQANINDGRTRNALRVFIYNALRAESDYTDAQAAAWGSATADEVLFTKQTVATAAGFTAWPVHSGAGGSQTSSTSASNRQLNFICIRDRNGHARAWRIKTAITGSAFNAFSTSYDKLTEAQIRTEFGLPAAATPLTYSNQTQSIEQGASGAALPAATGGTAPYTYELGTPGTGNANSPAISWASAWANQGTAQTLPGSHRFTAQTNLFADSSHTYIAYRSGDSQHTIARINLTTGAVTNAVTSNVSQNWFGACATPNGNRYILEQATSGVRVRGINSTSGAYTGANSFVAGSWGAIAAISNTQLVLVGYNGGRFTYRILTLGSSGASITNTGSNVNLAATPGLGTFSPDAVEYYDNKLYLTGRNGRTFGFALAANAAGTEIGAALTNGVGLVNDGGDFYAVTRPSNSTSQLHKLSATARRGVGFQASLPAGITFNATTRVISVASSVATGLQNLQLRVRDSASPVAELIRSVGLTVTAAAPTAVAGTLAIANKTVNLSSSASGTATIEAASGGTGTVSYALSVNGGTSCTLSGRTLTIPSGQAAGTFRLAVTATWTEGSSTATTTAFFNLTITRTQAPARGTFAPSAKSFSTSHNGSGSVTIDAASGGTGTITYQLRRPHATGLSLSGRTLSIAANTPAGTHSVTIRAIWTTPEGSQFVQASFNLVITRSARPAATGSFTLQSVTFGRQRSDATVRRTFAAATGGFGSVTYSLVGSPAGVSLSGRQLSFAASVTRVSVTVRATWTSGSTTAHLDSTATFTIPRSQAPATGTFRVQGPTLNLTHNAVGTFTLDAATGGTGTITYALVSPPAGISLSGRTVTVAQSVATGSYSLSARATWTTVEGSRSLTAAFTLTVNRAAAPRRGLPEDTTAKMFADLTTADKADFYEYTLPASDPAFYGNPTRLYAAGQKQYDGTNKATGMNGWIVGHIKSLHRAIDAHWCANSHTGQTVLLKIAPSQAAGGSDTRWNVCGETRGTGSGTFGQGASITDMVLADQEGRARYFSRESLAGAANYATANYEEQTDDARFYEQPVTPPPRIATKGGGGMPMWMIMAIYKRRKDKDED